MRSPHNTIPKDIPGYSGFARMEPVGQGLSGDTKWRIETAEDVGLLLRLTDIEGHDHKRAEFERMKRMDASGIPMSRPLGFGVCNGGQSVFQLLTWCEGENLERLLPVLPEPEQYAVGLKAGEILRRIHTVPVASRDTTDVDWNARYCGFMDASLRSFYNCGVEVDGADLVIDYFHANRHLLGYRPQRYLHGDYHAANMLYARDRGALSIVDWEIHLFNGYGDPWMELSMQETSHFSTGMIRGYFGGEPPEEYWRILALYTSIGAISSIPWAYYRFPDELASRLKLNADVMMWFERMGNPVPTWYLRKLPAPGS